ncbi:hypothetical protein [Novacetimonas maltaceti]|uniref:hypothetical protein n=1 Tax=Novacetimonas maltaceti TaxID=1203393 RepID=UPI0015E1A8E2|nr:hypothetical protein [Novacetimonas maltaceti]
MSIKTVKVFGEAFSKKLQKSAALKKTSYQYAAFRQPLTACRVGHFAADNAKADLAYAA